MNCEWCGDPMCEERLVVEGGLVKVKNVTAWHCTSCGTIEYRWVSPYQGSLAPYKAQDAR